MPQVTPQRIAAKNANALDNSTTRYSGKGPLIEHETYIPRSMQRGRGIAGGAINPSEQNIKTKDITLAQAGENTLHYLVRSPVKDIRDSALELQRVRKNAITSHERLVQLVERQKNYRNTTYDNPYATNNPFGKGYIAQTLYSFNTWFNATFLNNKEAQTQLKEMRTYDENLSQLAAVEGAIPAAEYHLKSDIAEAKKLEKNLERDVNKIAAKDNSQLSPGEKFLLTNLVAINNGEEYVPQIVIIKEATDAVLKETPDYAKAEALLKTPGLDLPALSSTAQRLNREQQISYQLALAVGGEDEKLGNELLDKAGLKDGLATTPAPFESRATLRLNATLFDTPEIKTSSNDISANIIGEYTPEEFSSEAIIDKTQETETPLDQAAKAIEAYFDANTKATAHIGKEDEKWFRIDADKKGKEAISAAQAADLQISTFQLDSMCAVKTLKGNQFDLKTTLGTLQSRGAASTDAMISDLRSNTNTPAAKSQPPKEIIVVDNSGNLRDTPKQTIK